MKNTNPKVDEYLRNLQQWQEELTRLRAIILPCGLTEELKWGKPCYTFQNRNIVILQEFKQCCAVLFAKGALLNDPDDLLEKPGELTQAARRIPFTSVQAIAEAAPVLQAYLREAIEVEKAGLEVVYKETEEFSVPAEFQNRLDELPALKAAFTALTPGRQRGYLLHFAAPKQSKTRASRVERCMPIILTGKGLNDPK